MFLDATYVKARVDRPGRLPGRGGGHRGVRRTGDREVLGVAVGDSEDGAFWTAFLRSLRARGLTGVRLVISDAHLGLKAAIAAGVRRARPGSGAGSTSCATCWPG